MVSKESKNPKKRSQKSSEIFSETFSEKSSEKSSNRDQRYTNSKYFANDPYLHHDNVGSKIQAPVKFDRE
jgi:hypothetical protein